MADWLKGVLSPQQEEEDKNLADESSKKEKTSALKVVAVEYIKDSGIYDIIIKYFTDLNDSEAIAKVKSAQTVQYIPCNIYRGYSYQRNLEYIDIKEDGYHDADSGWIEQNEGSGDIFHSQVRLAKGTKICDVSVLVKLCRDEKYNFTPVVVIVFDSGNEEDKDIFTVINPKKLASTTGSREKQPSISLKKTNKKQNSHLLTPPQAGFFLSQCRQIHS